MLNKKSILLLTASALLLLPSIARAEIDVQTGNSRTIVDDEGRIFIKSGHPDSEDWDADDYTYDRDRYRQRNYRSRCYTDSRTYKSDRAGISGNSVVHTQTSTTVCQ
ncbi:hypothetical protein [Pseudanabaena sp. PCC 6802]|uniref:hypothetical protein n=1 Tax=Pseudanabaena sp. PCC 6802 TaxID=118173 RepID=UPI00034DC3D6|nr:hypothetical protein [Pseudanabaena sp. PCC 6802]